MDHTQCPNYNICRLVTVEDFKFEKGSRKDYLLTYCQAGEASWSQCKRYITKNALNFCPDFVLPDTTLTTDEIIDKFDEENMN